MALTQTIVFALFLVVFPVASSRDPDIHRNVSQIITSRGFQVEEYDVVTKDGYIINIQRIINPKVATDSRPNLKPVILQHGILSLSVEWVLNSKPDDGPVGSIEEKPKQTNSLALYLANRGFDVFLSNIRGNTYGRRHVKLKTSNPIFWNFSFDQNIEYDLPAVIEKVQLVTGKTKLGYVGYSQGSLLMFGLLSDKPEYADIIEPFVALAPVAFVKNIKSPVKSFSPLTRFLSLVDAPFMDEDLNSLAPHVCDPKITRRACLEIYHYFIGNDGGELDESLLTAILAHLPAGTSVQNLNHYGQAIDDGRFAHYSYGPLLNEKYYGRPESPNYDLSKIRSKSIAMFVADNDYFASPDDVRTLLGSLQVEPYKIVNVSESKPHWNHVDFTFGRDAGAVINPHVFEILKQFN